MIREALEKLEMMAVLAAGPQFKEIDPRKWYMVIDEQGNDQSLMAPKLKPIRDHRANDLDTIVAFASRFMGSGNTSAIWYSRHAVTCLCDDGDRADRVTLALNFSEQYKKLAYLEQTKPCPNMDQRALIFMLRTLFRDNLGRNPEIIASLRKVKLNTEGKVDMSITHGRSSIGKSLTAEVTGAGTIPEYITLTIPIFANRIPASAWDVECAIEIIETGPAFQLVPLPGQIEQATVMAEQQIHDALAGMVKATKKDVPIYYGQP